MSSRGSCPLEQDLREIASREFDVLEGNNSSDEECRRSCAVVLTAIDGFLRKWSDVDVGRNNGNSISGSFPLPLLRELTSKIVREVGPGDTLFRTSWLRLLRRSTTKSVAVFNFVLEFLPCAFLRNQEEDNALKTELLSALDFVLETDSNSLSPVLECLQRIALPRRTEKKAVFRFIINHVSKAQEHSLGQVIKSLFDLATDEGDLSVAIQAMRERVGSETAALLVAQEIFGINEEVGQLEVFDEYLAIVEEECNPGGTEGILRCVDVLVLLLHRHIPKYGTAIENQFDRLIGNGNMNNRLLASIARLSSLYDPGAPLDRGNYTWIQCLDDHLIWLLIFICHGPIRSPKLVSSEKALHLAKDFGVDLLLLSGQGGKHLVITAVLQFAEELQATMKKASTNHSHTSTAQSYSPGLSGVEFSALLRMQSVLFMILDSVAEKIPDVLSLHMRAINRSLTNWYMDYAAVESTCSLMVRVSRHRRRGSATDDSNDSSNDPFFVARALIFSGKADDSYSLAISQEGSVESCVRGLILASKILLSCHQNPTEISLLWQSVKSVLLPPTNRLPHPRRGNHGIRALRFFFAWMQQTNDDSARLLKPGIFGTLTSILTTSRLVQYTNFLKKVSAPKSSVLCYTCRPHCFRDDGSNQRQFHKMIFSFDALQSDINFCHPPNWELSTRFVFELIDTYLGIGRTRSTGKWIAHAWVEASFDFPLMDIYHLRASNARQQRMVNLVEGISNDFDTSRDSMTTKGLSEKEFGDMLKQMKKSERTEILQSLLRSTMSFCLGLALSASILHNTFEQYAGVLDEQETTGFCHQRAEATRLMQYQLAKIYDIAAKCRSMETLFRGISNANLRTKSRRKKSNQGWKNIGMQFEKMVSTPLQPLTCAQFPVG